MTHNPTIQRDCRDKAASAPDFHVRPMFPTCTAVSALCRCSARNICPAFRFVTRINDVSAAFAFWAKVQRVACVKWVFCVQEVTHQTMPFAFLTLHFARHFSPFAEPNPAFESDAAKAGRASI